MNHVAVIRDFVTLTGIGLVIVGCILLPALGCVVAGAALIAGTMAWQRHGAAKK